MVYECEGGTPRKGVVKKPLKAGDVIKTGQYVRYEEEENLTDDQVKYVCDDVAPDLCRTVEGFHMTYYRVTNTLFIAEGQVTQDQTVPPNLAGNLYLLQTYWEAYRIPIIIGIAALGCLGGFMALRKR
jgi:hypothetical protein